MLRRSFLGSLLAAAYAASPLRSLFCAAPPAALQPPLAEEGLEAGAAVPGAEAVCECWPNGDGTWTAYVSYPDGSWALYLAEMVDIRPAGMEEGSPPVMSFEFIEP